MMSRDPRAEDWVSRVPRSRSNMIKNTCTMWRTEQLNFWAECISMHFSLWLIVTWRQGTATAEPKQTDTHRHTTSRIRPAWKRYEGSNQASLQHWNTNDDLTYRMNPTALPHCRGATSHCHSLPPNAPRCGLIQTCCYELQSMLAPTLWWSWRPVSQDSWARSNSSFLIWHRITDQEDMKHQRS